ncbi:hypothetical protein F5X99DRAFT_375770 [Biscogniauxia marginata]|nr:hypothetical protein F5X99DRAFT_375770 [Biscogniauxia marginata]
MSNDPLEYLGLSCPRGGTFHICQNSAIQFIGCCDIDPCGDGGCPSSRLHPASFNSNRYSDIPSQDCVDTSSGALWYTCTSGPFLGCCKSNPCEQNGVCRSADLVGGKLGDDPNRASVFLTTSAPTTTATSASSSATNVGGDVSSMAGSGDETSPHNRTSNGMIGGIVGGVIGGLVVLVLAICLLCRRMKRRKNGTIFPVGEGQMTMPNPPSSPYQDLYKGNHTFRPPDTSPYSNASTPQHRGSIPRSLFSPLWPNARLSVTKDKYEKPIHERDSNYDASHHGGQSLGLIAVAELEAPMPIPELENTALGHVPTSQTFHGILYREVEGSMPKISGA